MISRNVGTGRRRIITVDDDLQLNISAMKLKSFDVQASLSDRAELADIIRELNPRQDAILLDERMPRMTGIDA